MSRKWDTEEGKALARRLNADKGFHAYFKADKVLSSLWNSHKDEPLEIEMEFLISIGGLCSLGKLSFPAPTPGVMMLLGFIKSPFLASGDVETTGVDCDLALWILANGRKAFELEGSALGSAIVEASIGLCQKMDIDYGDAAKAIRRIIDVSFIAFRMMPDVPRKKDKDDEPEDSGLDVEWLARIVCLVSQVVSLSPDEIKWKLPMVDAGHYAIRALQRNGNKGIKRKMKSAQILARMNFLMDAWAKEHYK